MKRLAMAAALSMLAFSAHTQESANADNGSTDDGQWRFAANAAFSDYDGDTTGIDDSTVGFKFSAQLQMNKWFGVEAAYLNTSDFSNEQTVVGGPAGDLSYRGFSFSGVGYLPLLGDDIDLYGVLGYFDFDTDLSESDIVISSGHTDGLTIGAGATLHISDALGIKTEFDWYDVDDADLWSIILGVEYRY